jgi:serine/threonine-protein kinase
MAPPTLGSSRASEPAGATPTQFGPYLLAECIGRGGMAAVYKAKRRSVGAPGRQVVVKTILPEHAKDRRVLRQFTEEARLSTQLRHDNIVRAHDSGFIGGKPFLELEYLSGLNLRQLWDTVKARGQRIPVSIALTLGTQICRGLAYAHSFVDKAGVARPIIHRDVSPANVMICCDGSVKLLDFGSACLTRGQTVSIDTFSGKLAYMSPEQLARRQLDRRADVFALGALLHELLSGRRLFSGVDDAETVRRVQSLVIERPSEWNPDVPPALDGLTLRALRYDPEQRYASAAEMLIALERIGDAAASKDGLLRYLGSIAPEVFTSTCEGCARQLPYGVECPQYRTQVEPLAPSSRAPSSDALVARPIIDPSTASPPPVPCRSSRPRRGLTARSRHLRLLLYVLFGHLQNWAEAQRLRLGVAVEEIRILWACARSRSEPPRLATPMHRGATPPARRASVP